MGPLCNDQHPASLEWRCTCGKESGHADDHRCYGCGFEWGQHDPQSTGHRRAQEFIDGPAPSPVQDRAGLPPVADERTEPPIQSTEADND